MAWLGTRCHPKKRLLHHTCCILFKWHKNKPKHLLIKTHLSQTTALFFHNLLLTLQTEVWRLKMRNITQTDPPPSPPLCFSETRADFKTQEVEVETRWKHSGSCFQDGLKYTVSLVYLEIKKWHTKRLGLQTTFIYIVYCIVHNVPSAFSLFRWHWRWLFTLKG